MRTLNYIFTLLSIFVLILFAADSAFSQDKKGKEDKTPVTPTTKTETKIQVKANVMVLDEQGKVVTDIKQEDLKVFEDGVEQKITYFAKKENTLNFGVLIDNTGSLQAQIKIVNKVASTFISNMQGNDEAFFIRFVSSDKIEVLQDWTSDKATLYEALESTFTEGGSSAIIDAIYLSAQKIMEREKTDKTKHYAVILLTDGEERDSYYKKEDLYKLFVGSDVQLFSIIFFGDLKNKIERKSRNFINELTLRTNGATFFVNYRQSKKKEYEDVVNLALKTIWAELSAPYIIGYTPTNQNFDGTTRKLTVQVANGSKGEKRQAFIRESYEVPEK